MNSEHVISDEVLNEVMAATGNSCTWLVYNTMVYFLNKEDVHFFKTEKDAMEWAFENNSKTEAYRPIHINSITDLFRQIEYGHKLELSVNQSKKNFMNLQNLDYLKENLRFMGFGDKLHADLEKNIQQGFPEFVLKMQSEFSGKKMDSALSFRKSDQSDMYFFNRFDAQLHHKNDPSKNVQQTFYLNKGHGVTLKEAFNLLEGRAVFKELSNKEGQKFNAWIQLDFKDKASNGNYKTKQFHQNYGFNLADSIKNLPIKELQNEQSSERLMMSLEKGNVQSVTMTTAGREQMFYMEANPQFKTVTVYDAHMKMLGKEQRAELFEKGVAKSELQNGQTKNNKEGQTIGAGQEKSNKQEQTREAVQGKTVAGTAKSESVKVDREKTKSEKQSESPTEDKGKKEKKEAVKNLLPQKQGNGTKRGLRA